MATTILLSAFEFHYFRLITKVGTYSFDLSVSDVFHFSQCPLCSPGEEKGYKLQYSALENPMDCIVHGGRKESDTLYSSMLLQMSGFPSFVRLNNVYIYIDNHFFVIHLTVHGHLGYFHILVNLNKWQ